MSQALESLGPKSPACSTSKSPHAIGAGARTGAGATTAAAAAAAAAVADLHQQELELVAGGVEKDETVLTIVREVSESDSDRTFCDVQVNECIIFFSTFQTPNNAQCAQTVMYFRHCRDSRAVKFSTRTSAQHCHCHQSRTSCTYLDSYLHLHLNRHLQRHFAFRRRSARAWAQVVSGR